MYINNHSSGTEYYCYDDTDISLPGYGSYIYVFKNKGRSLGVCRYISEWDLVDAVVAAASCQEAIELLHQQLGNRLDAKHRLTINLIGVDLMSSEGSRIITHQIKPDLG